MDLVRRSPQPCARMVSADVTDKTTGPIFLLVVPNQFSTPALKHANPFVLAGVQHCYNEARRRRTFWACYVTFFAGFVVRASIRINPIHATPTKRNGLPGQPNSLFAQRFLLFFRKTVRASALAL